MIPAIPSLALPVGESPHGRSMPVVTWALIALQLLTFFVAVLPTMSDGTHVDRALVAEWRRDIIKAPASEELTTEELAEREAMTAEERQIAEMVEDLVQQRARPDATTLFLYKSGYRAGSPSFHKLLSSLFLHAGLLATAFHVLLLWIFGKGVECHIGHLRFFVLYAGGGALGAFLGSYLSLTGSTLPVLSSTSALGTILGAYFVFFRDHEVQVAYLGRLPWRPPTAGTLFVPAWLALPFLTLFVAMLGHLTLGVRGATWAGVAIGAVSAFLLHESSGIGESTQIRRPNLTQR